MYKYRITEADDRLEKFQQKRIDAFDDIEKELMSLIKPLRKAKIRTVKYYKQDEPKSYSVLVGTDLIRDYIKDIKTLLEENWYENFARTIYINKRRKRT